jgi:TRAP-type uncharacterized transport system fused permease subunit
MAATPQVPAAPAQAAEAAFDETGVKRELTGMAWKVVAGAALAFSTYQLLIAAFSPLSSLVTRSLHVGFLLLLAFLIHPVSAKANRRRIAWYDALLAGLAFALAFYRWLFEADLIQRSGDASTTDLAVGTLVIVLLFEAARRVFGPALPIICATSSPTACSGNTSPTRSPTAAMASTRSSARSISAPRGSTAFRRWCRQPPSSCSSCSAASSSTPG